MQDGLSPRLSCVFDIEPLNIELLNELRPGRIVQTVQVVNP